MCYNILFNKMKYNRIEYNLTQYSTVLFIQTYIYIYVLI